VLHVVNRYGQRSETFLTDLIADLDAVGWEARLVSHWPPVNRAEFPFPPDDRFVHPRRPAVWRSALGRLAGRPARVRGAEWWREELRAVRPDIVHVHFAWTAGRVAFERLGTPTVVSFHGSDVRSWPHASAANQKVYDELLRRLRYAIASSQSIAEQLRADGFHGRIDLVNPGVHLDRFPFAPPNGDIVRRRLLFVGRQVECKGLDVLLRAMRRVVDERPETTLVVIGDGDDFARNRELARLLDLERHVEFRGAQPHSEVARELRHALALVVPSRTSAAGEAEGHPVAPKEAFAAGVPVIATSCGGLPEVFPPDLRATLVGENDAPALAEAIVAFLESPDTWRERSAVARKWAEEQFDARRLAERVAGLYGDMRDAHRVTQAR